MLNFCPVCGSKLHGDKFCANCGADLIKYGGTSDSSISFASDNSLDSALDSALENLFSLANEQQAEADKLRVFIIRGMYDEATRFCNQMIERNPMNKAGYIGLIRIVSNNYKILEGAEIDEQIRIAEEIFTNNLLDDAEYAAYIYARNELFAERERKCIEAERKRIEAERAAAETERRRIEADNIRKTFELKDNGDGTYALTKLKDKSITVANIPNIVTSIGDYAFFECSSLTSLIIPNSVTSIGDHAFNKCIKLINVVIPDSVTSIGSSAFSDCGLTSVTIPNSVVSIDYEAFHDCGLESVIIDGCNTKIGNTAFNFCPLKVVSVPHGVKYSKYVFPKKCKIKKRKKCN